MCGKKVNNSYVTQDLGSPAIEGEGALPRAPSSAGASGGGLCVVGLLRCVGQGRAENNVGSPVPPHQGPMLGRVPDRHSHLVPRGARKQSLDPVAQAGRIRGTAKNLAIEGGYEDLGRVLARGGCDE